jgi:hypothetical protein
MNGLLEGLLPKADAAGSIKTWLKAEAYSKRVLLGSAGANPWQSVASYVTWFAQTQNLCHSDVATLSIAEVFDRQVLLEGGLASKLSNRQTPKVALRRLIESATARELINEVLFAVLAQTSQPVVLGIPSPKAWLQHAAQLAGLTPTALLEDEIEDAAAYIADLLRALSAHPLAAILLEEAADDQSWAQQLVKCYQPLLNVAQHYRWSAVLRLPQQQSIEAPWSEYFSVLIGQIRSQQQATGIDVTQEFHQALSLPKLAAGEFYFIEIDPNSAPEQISEKILALQQAA